MALSHKPQLNNLSKSHATKNKQMRTPTLIQILKIPFYGTLSIILSVTVFTLALWLPNFKLLWIVLSATSTSYVEKLSFVWSLYGSIQTNFTPLSAVYTILIAILFGINTTLLVYYIKKMRGGVRGLVGTGSLGIGGLISGIFGIGCAACGSFILTSLLPLFGAGGFLTLLPLGGGEFGLIGVCLLGYSITMLLRKIHAPLVCAIRTDYKD